MSEAIMLSSETLERNRLKSKRATIGYLANVERRTRNCDKIMPQIDELVMRKLHIDSGQYFSLENLYGHNRRRILANARKRCWFLSRLHPDAGASYLHLARHYNRNHTTPMDQFNYYRWQLRAGYWRSDLDAMQWVCDRLTERGFAQFDVKSAL